MRNVLNSYGRALLSQLHGKILLLSAVPFILSVVLWGRREELDIYKICQVISS